MSRRADFLPPGGSISIPGSMRQLMKKGKEKGKAALGGHGKSWGGGAGVVGCPTPGEGVLSGLLSPVLCTWLLWTVVRAGSAWPLKYLLCITPSLRPCAALRVATGPPSLLLHLASRWGGGGHLMCLCSWEWLGFLMLELSSFPCSALGIESASHLLGSCLASALRRVASLDQHSR